MLDWLNRTLFGSVLPYWVEMRLLQGMASRVLDIHFEVPLLDQLGNDQIEGVAWIAIPSLMRPPQRISAIDFILDHYREEL